ncbi:MAG: DUF3604 domain-containing protein [Kiritimatiellales bacterium]
MQFAANGHPEAYIRHTLGMGKGSCSIRCSVPELYPSQQVDWVEITYMASEEGIVPGGRVVLAVPPGPPEAAVQIDAPDRPAYMEVQATSPVRVQLAYPPFEIQENCLVTKSRVEVFFPEGLSAKETVTFRWNDVLLDVYARRWDGDSWRFHLLCDHDGDGLSEELPEIAAVPKTSGPAVYLLARSNSMALPGEPVRINVAAFDRYNNPATGYTGEVNFEIERDAGANVPAPYHFSGDDRGAHVFDVIFDKPGVYWLVVKDGQGLQCRTNPIEILAEEPAARLYWGDLHVHTEMSADARVWAHTTSTYAGSYRIGRYRYGLDFQANADHHGLLQGNYTRDEWEAMKHITNAANVPGHFVTLICNEYSHPLGDANAYFRQDDIPYLDHEPYSRSGDPQTLYARLRRFGCPLIPHHVSQNMRPFHWENYDARLMIDCEIFSNHGRAEFLGNKPHYSKKKVPTMEGTTWVEQLQKGYQMGCVASSDDHWARPGTCGLTGIWSRKGLTRDGLVDALLQRACYATTGDRTILYFHVTQGENTVVDLRAYAGSIIEKTEIIKNGETVVAEEPQSLMVKTQWMDPAPPGNDWYYVRLTLREQEVCEEYMRNKKQFIWSSPVWIGCSEEEQ